MSLPLILSQRCVTQPQNPWNPGVVGHVATAASEVRMGRGGLGSVGRRTERDGEAIGAFWFVD